MAGPLENITVVDLSRVMAAPFATQMLSDFGATVWKVEALTGDHTREWGSQYFDAGNRGKRSLAVNLKDERGQRIVRSLAEKADVFVENFKPGDLRRYGLNYEHMSRTPAVLSGLPPEFGEHTVDALASELSMSGAEIKELVRDNVIRTPDDSTE